MVEELQVMLVDDNTEVLESVSKSLGTRDFCIRVFQDPYKAIEAYRSDSFDVAITGLEMPVISGFEVFQWLSLPAMIHRLTRQRQ
jgi:CheY-like chemotaxis protein